MEGSGDESDEYESSKETIKSSRMSTVNQSTNFLMNPTFASHELYVLSQLLWYSTSQLAASQSLWLFYCAISNLVGSSEITFQYFLIQKASKLFLDITIFKCKHAQYPTVMLLRNCTAREGKKGSVSIYFPNIRSSFY